MSIPVASEKKLLSAEEFEAVKATHHPAISELTLEALRSAKNELGERREKLRARLVENRRARVRRTSRETAQGSAAPPLARQKQVFAKALRRVNHELHRREAIEAKSRPALAGSPPQAKPMKAARKVSPSAPKDGPAAKPQQARPAARRPEAKAKGEGKGQRTAKKEG